MKVNQWQPVLLTDTNVQVFIWAQHVHLGRKIHMGNKITTLEVGEGKAVHLDEALSQLVHPLEHLHLNLKS